MNRHARRAETARQRREGTLPPKPPRLDVSGVGGASVVDELAESFATSGPRLTRTREREEIDRLTAAIRLSSGPPPETVIWKGEVVRTKDLVAAIMKRRAELGGAPARMPIGATDDPIPDGMQVIATSAGLATHEQQETEGEEQS